jgi:hypothetical protein
MLEAVKSYFSLHRAPPRPAAADARVERETKRIKRAVANAASVWWWSLGQWGALFAGVACRMWMDGDSIGPARIATAAITATLIFPAAYRKAMAESEPHFLKLCVTFAAGHGYTAMLDSL